MKVKLRLLFMLSLFVFPGFTFNICLADPSGNSNTASKTTQTNIRDTIDIRIGWVFSMANAPIIIAEKKGYFLQQGISVKLKSYKSGPDLYKDIQAGKLDMAYIGAPPIYHWYAKGLKSKIIAKVNYGQAAVITHNDSNINKIADLRGKKFGGFKTGSGMDVLLRGFILDEKAGINPRTDVNIITMKPEEMGLAVEKNKIAAALSWEPFTSRSILRGDTKIILDVNKEIPRYPWYVIMAMPKAIKNKRAGIVKVIKAHKKAIAFLNSSPTAGDKIITQAFNLTPVKNKQKRVYSSAEIIAQAKKRLGWQARLTRNDARFMQKLVNYSYKLGYIKNKINVNDIIDISFLFEAVIN